MEEEIFYGRGDAISPGKDESYGRPNPKPGNTGKEFVEKEYFESIFTSCCPNAEGLVRVSKLLDVFRDLRKDVENDPGLCSNSLEPLEALKFMLDPTDVDPLISSKQFLKCVQGCVGLLQNPTPPSSNGGSIPCSPSPKKYSINDGELDFAQKVSELEFQIYKLHELNTDLSEQLSATEEEKIALHSKLNLLEKRCTSYETNNEMLSKELDETKSRMNKCEATIKDLRIQTHQLERENNDLISTTNQAIQDAEILDVDLRHSKAALSTKNLELERIKNTLTIMDAELASSALMKVEKQKQIEDLEDTAASLKIAVNQLSSEKQQLEMKLTELSINKLKGSIETIQNSDHLNDSQLFDMSSEIEIDDNFANAENRKLYFDDVLEASDPNAENPYVENASTDSTSSSLKNSWHSELKALREDLWGPEFIGNDNLTFQPTVELIRKIKHDFKQKLCADAKYGGNFGEMFLKTNDVDFGGDNIVLVNKELLELHEQINLMTVILASKRPSTCDAFTFSPSNEMLTSSTQTEFKVRTSKTSGSYKKGAVIILLLTTLLFGIRGITHGVNDHCSSFISNHGSLFHHDRPIL